MVTLNEARNRCLRGKLLTFGADGPKVKVKVKENMVRKTHSRTSPQTMVLQRPPAAHINQRTGPHHITSYDRWRSQKMNSCIQCKNAFFHVSHASINTTWSQMGNYFMSWFGFWLEWHHHDVTMESEKKTMSWWRHHGNNIIKVKSS